MATKLQKILATAALATASAGAIAQNNQPQGPFKYSGDKTAFVYGGNAYVVTDSGLARVNAPASVIAQELSREATVTADQGSDNYTPSFVERVFGGPDNYSSVVVTTLGSDESNALLNEVQVTLADAEAAKNIQVYEFYFDPNGNVGDIGNGQYELDSLRNVTLVTDLDGSVLKNEMARHSIENNFTGQQTAQPASVQGNPLVQPQQSTSEQAAALAVASATATTNVATGYGDARNVPYFSAKYASLSTKQQSPNDAVVFDANGVKYFVARGEYEGLNTYKTLSPTPHDVATDYIFMDGEGNPRYVTRNEYNEKHGIQTQAASEAKSSAGTEAASAAQASVTVTEVQPAVMAPQQLVVESQAVTAPSAPTIQPTLADFVSAFPDAIPAFVLAEIDPCLVPGAPDYVAVGPAGEALMSRPKLLLLDEPSLGLAPEIAMLAKQPATDQNKGQLVVALEQYVQSAPWAIPADALAQVDPCLVEVQTAASAKLALETTVVPDSNPKPQVPTENNTGKDNKSAQTASAASANPQANNQAQGNSGSTSTGIWYGLGIAGLIAGVGVLGKKAINIMSGASSTKDRFAQLEARIQNLETSLTTAQRNNSDLAIMLREFLLDPENAVTHAKNAESILRANPQLRDLIYPEPSTNHASSPRVAPVSRSTKGGASTTAALVATAFAGGVAATDAQAAPIVPVVQVTRPAEALKAVEVPSQAYNVEGVAYKSVEMGSKEANYLGTTITGAYFGAQVLSMVRSR